jgi:hypothetical protein
MVADHALDPQPYHLPRTTEGMAWSNDNGTSWSNVVSWTNESMHAAVFQNYTYRECTRTKPVVCQNFSSYGPFAGGNTEGSVASLPGSNWLVYGPCVLVTDPCTEGSVASLLRSTWLVYCRTAPGFAPWPHAGVPMPGVTPTFSSSGPWGLINDPSPFHLLWSLGFN